MINNTLIDNSANLKLVDTLNTIIKHPEINEICIATGYWDLKGTALITESLKIFLKKDNTKLRLLIGKDPNVYQKDLTKASYSSAKKYPEDYIKIDLQNVELNNTEYQEAAKLLIDYGLAENSKIQVHKFNTNENDEKQFFHSKCYIFTNGTDDLSIGIIGSSNFTQKGLEGNSELNYLESNGMIVNHKSNGTKKGHIQWFNEKWALSQDWTKEFVIEVQKSPVGQAAKKAIQLNSAANKNITNPYTVLSPKEAYYKFLITQFNSFLQSNGKILPKDYIPSDPKFMQLNYQIDAVNQAFGILEKHRGVIIADVVGLGKTFTALMIVKRHLIETGFSKSILVITPPAIEQSWKSSIEYFDKDATQQIGKYINITTIGCLDTESDSEENDTGDFTEDFVEKEYSMVVIDESHRFRNNKTQMYIKLEDLLTEQKPFTVLLSATPQNNRPSDILNQLYLFEHNHRHSTLTGLTNHNDNLESYFAEKENIYSECIKDYKEKDANGNKIYKDDLEKQKDIQTLKDIADQIRDDVLNQLVIRRTRTDLQSPLYKADLDKQGIVFPEIQKPEGIPYEMTGTLADLFIKTLDVIAPKVANKSANSLGYYRYKAIQYLDAKSQKIYAYNSKKQSAGSGSITATGISERLAELMQLLLVKRLESSRDAFEESLCNLKTNTQNMITMFKEDKVFICPDLDVNKIIKENKNIAVAYNELEKKALEQNKKRNTKRNAVYKAGDFVQCENGKSFLENLKTDYVLISSLYDEWLKNKQDKKRDKFISSIESKFLNPAKNSNGKMVVFTECIATQTMLAECLKDYYDGKVLSITAENRKKESLALSKSFDANYKVSEKDKEEYDKTPEYDILITTDVLSEGVNLHKANTIVNYDSPWNSTRLMQRLGRINRIGSTSNKIYSYNFYPSSLGDSQINLKKRTLVKLQAFHNMFGEDSQIYTTEESLVKIDRPKFILTQGSDPKIEYIKDLKDFKNANPNEYDRLLQITGTIASSIQKDTEDECCYSKVENGLFKLYNEKGKRFSTPNQLTFCKILKENKDESLFTLTDEQYLQYKHNSIVTYNTQRDNESVSLKAKNRSGEKVRLAALKKLQDVKKQIKNPEDKKIYNDIEAAVRGNSPTLIRKIEENDLSPACDFNISTLLAEWNTLLTKKVSGKEPFVEFEFIVCKK